MKSSPVNDAIAGIIILILLVGIVSLLSGCQSPYEHPPRY